MGVDFTRILVKFDTVTAQWNFAGKCCKIALSGELAERQMLDGLVSY